MEVSLYMTRSGKKFSCFACSERLFNFKVRVGVEVGLSDYVQGACTQS